LRSFPDGHGSGDVRYSRTAGSASGGAMGIRRAR
jgi:hypothetical protein